MQIEIKNGKKLYVLNNKQSVLALNDVNLFVKQGDYISLCGTSGSGKTTLLNILGCLDILSEGTFLLDDNDVSKMSDKERSRIRNKNIGFVLQDFGLINTRTVAENIMVPLFFSKSKVSDYNRLIEKVMEQLKISDLKNRKIQSLSGGQKQRVAIARALVNDPSIILADEPTGALDSSTKKEIIKLFNEINSLGKTIIVVTHDMEMAVNAQRRMMISDGRIYEEK